MCPYPAPGRPFRKLRLSDPKQAVDDGNRILPPEPLSSGSTFESTDQVRVGKIFSAHREAPGLEGLAVRRLQTRPQDIRVELGLSVQQVGGAGLAAALGHAFDVHLGDVHLKPEPVQPARRARGALESA